MIFKRGKVYWFDFWFRGRRYRQSTGLGNRNAALHVEAKKRVQVAEQQAGIQRLRKAPQFEVFVRDEFIPWDKTEHVAHPRTHRRYLTSIHSLLRVFGKSTLDEIRTSAIERYKIRRLQEVTETGVNRDLAALRRILNFAVRQGYLARSTFQGVRLYREKPGMMRILSHDEEARYLSVASKTLKDVAALMLETGMRPEEVFTLRMENVYLVKGYLHVPTGKTQFARRNIPLSKRAISVLKPRMKGAYLFPNRLDSELPLTTVQKEHDKARRKAGLQFRLYDLRHTFGSRAVMAGVDLPTLKELMGHSHISMTMRYVHPNPEHKQQAIRKLESFNQAQSPQNLPQSVVYSP